jgi:radical SAM superfamily enzyme YgiQ (UPF0313 family)
MTEERAKVLSSLFAALRSRHRGCFVFKTCENESMLGKEVFLLTRPQKQRGLFSVSWFYPNTYAVGMAGLGYQLVWRLLDQDADVFVRRGFTDIEEPGETAELFGFTVSWELDYLNVMKVLQEHDIGVTANERTENAPIVFGGGPVLSANPEPFADLFDVILIGDAETAVPAFIASWKEARKLKSRRERLEYLSTTAGVYVPSLYTCQYSDVDNQLISIKPNSGLAPAHIQKQIFAPPADYVAHSVILSPDTTWGDMFLAEIARSCPQECRFCLASYLTRPFRPGNVDAIMNAIDLGLQHTKKIGLLGPSVTEHPQFDKIADALLLRPETQVSIASIRADTVSDNVLKMLRGLGQRSVTIAIESGSERLRAIMKKNLTQDEIEHAINLLDTHGFESVKLYGIAGLPHELDSDLTQTIDLLQKLKKSHKRMRIVFGISSFVPKAQTPFQRYGRDKRAGEKLEHVRKNLARVGVDVRPESHNWSDIQAALSRADRRISPVLIDAARTGGKLGDWKRAFRNRPKSTPDMEYYAFRTMAVDETMPWAHLMESHKQEFLEKHLNAASALSDQNPTQELSGAGLKSL